MSTDQGQVVKDDTHGQPETSAPVAPATIEIDGQQVSLEEVRAGYMRQADYTKKTMELAEARKKSEPAPSTEDTGDLGTQVDNLIDLMAPKLNERFVSRQETDLEKFLQHNPDLESKRKLLQDLGKGTNKSYWDIASEYDLKPSDALEKSKSRRIVGESKLEEKPSRNVADMTPDEWTQWKKENTGKRQSWNAKNMDR